MDTLTALSIHLELGADWQRFHNAHRVRSWLGLTPSLNQSGESSRQGAITKTGSAPARRLLIESAWHYARELRIGATLEDSPAEMTASAQTSHDVPRLGTPTATRRQGGSAAEARDPRFASGSLASGDPDVAEALVGLGALTRRKRS